jgi:alpha-L-fucosidase
MNVGLLAIGLACLFASPGAAAAQAATAGDNEVYKPTRESLSRYQVPEWFHDAKIGFFYHWGPHSVIGDHWNEDIMDFCRQQGKYEGSNLAKRNPPGQWAANMYPSPGKPQSEQNSCSLLQRKWYGDQKEFGYKDLIPLMTGNKFDPEEMVRLLSEAGVRYLAPQAIHHDGFAMWDSQVIDEFNAAKMGPKKDTVRMVVEQARRRGMKVGVSTHAARHSWYYPKPAGYDVSDPRYVQLYGEGLGEGGLPRPEAMQKWKDTLGELVETFSPDYIFVDGGTADTYCNKKSYMVQDALREIVAHYYNHARANGYEPVLTFKRESLYKEEAVPDYEGGALIDIAPYKWQTHANIAGWFYRPGQFVTPSHRLFQKTIDVVSKNGNMLLNLGLRADGSVPESEVAFLKDMADWIQVVGEGLYGSRPWLVYGEIEPGQEFFFREHSRKGIVYDDPHRIRMGTTKTYDGDIRYTRSKDGKTIYATRMSWPEEAFTLASFAADRVGEDVKIKTIFLLGSDADIQWKRTDKGIVIIPPSTPVFESNDWPVMFKLETL